jgi:hypothetical protein
MNAPARQVDVIEQVALHERAIAARVVGSDAKELVEVERGGMSKVGAPAFMKGDEFAIQGDGSTTCGQSQHDPRVLRYRSRKIRRQRPRYGFSG